MECGPRTGLYLRGHPRRGRQPRSGSPSSPRTRWFATSLRTHPLLPTILIQRRLWKNTLRLCGASRRGQGISSRAADRAISTIEDRIEELKEHRPRAESPSFSGRRAGKRRFRRRRPPELVPDADLMPSHSPTWGVTAISEAPTPGPGVLGDPLTEAQQAEIRRLAERADESVEASLGQHPEGLRLSLAAVERLVPGLRTGYSQPRRRLLAGDAPHRVVGAPESSPLSSCAAPAVLEIRRRLGRPLQFDDSAIPGLSSRPAPDQGRPPGQEGGTARGESAGGPAAARSGHGSGAEPLPARPGAAADRIRRRLPSLGVAGFDLQDVSFTAEGLVLFVARSKTDQERRGGGGVQAVPTSPLCAVSAVSAARHPRRCARPSLLPHRLRRPSDLWDRRPPAADRHQDRGPLGQAGDQGPD